MKRNCNQSLRLLGPVCLTVLLGSIPAGSLMLMSTASQAAAINGVTDFSDLVEQVAPAVVKVTVTRQPGMEMQAFSGQVPDVLRQFFGEQFQMPDGGPQARQGYGSAFFISPDGYLLTNHHVVGDARKITVTLNDRRELDAELVGSDPRTDIAVLKVKPGHYPVLKLGDSSRVRVGEPVLAIGSPFGFDYSASAGIVSARARSLNRESAVPFIQSDVALNPGSSGGPLFNKNGDVIGINSRIFSGTGGYMGLSFSVPSDVAKDIYEQIRQSGQVSRAYLGVIPQDIDRNLAELYQLDKPEGALITRVDQGTAAQKAGLREGDIVLRFNNQPVGQATDLINIVARARPGKTVPVELKRDGKTVNINVTLQPVPVVMAATTTPSQTSPERAESALGVQVRSITPQERAAGAPAGVVIQALSREGLAARTGLQPGDVVTRLNLQPTPNVQMFAHAAGVLPRNRMVAIHVLRRGVPLILGLRMD